MRRRDDHLDKHVCLGGVKFDNVTMDEAVRHVDHFVRTGGSHIVVTPNVDHVLRFEQDPEYARIVQRAALVLIDSQPLVMLSRFIRRPLKERVAGSDLFPRLCEHCANQGYKVFLLGGKAGTAEQSATLLRKRYPNLKVVGTYYPPMDFEKSPEENRKAVEAVSLAKPDVVFVGLGSPKQEYWIARHMEEYGAPVSIGVGITFSFMCGDVKRAPLWMQKAGLEWLHRLACEPRRLWRRYLRCCWNIIPLVMSELWASWRADRRPAVEAESMPATEILCDITGNDGAEAVGAIERKGYKLKTPAPVATVSYTDSPIAS